MPAVRELCWMASTIQSRTICHVRGGACAVNVHAVAIACRRLSPAVKRPVNTRPVKHRQSFARQSGVLLNSNLGNLSRPWMLHFAAEIDNRSPRKRLHHRNHIQISEWGPGAPHPFPICPRSASRANPAKVSRDMAALPRTQPRSTETDRHKIRDSKNGRTDKIDLYIPT